MKKLLLFIGTIALLASSCTKKEQSNHTIIKGKIDYACNEIKFEWFKVHSAEMNPKTYFAAVDSLGNFEVNIPIQQLSKGVMNINNQRQDLVLIPNDQLVISISRDSITFSGKGSAKNEFLFNLSKHKTSSKLDIMMSWYTKKLEFNDFFTMIEAYANTREIEIKKFNATHSLEKEFVEYFNIETYLESVDLYEKSAIAYSRKNHTPIDSLKIPLEFKKQYSIKGLINDKYLVSSNYLDIIGDLVRTEVKKMMDNNNSLNKDSVLLSVVMDSLSGKTREHLLVQKIYYDLSIENKYDSLLVSAFNTIKSDKNCINIVDTELTNFNQKKAMIGAPLHAEFLETALADTSNIKTTLAEVLAKNKGKVIYIDTWSLNCGPCRMAMPFSKKLEEKLKDYPISFIYLTVDDYSDKLWDKVFEVSLTKNNHYRFEKGFSSKLHRLFNIILVPTYILIDKEGNLVSYKAERPFNNKWQENSELEKKLIDLAS
ncbi:TlpA disulfide reductase family protein [Ancylomarina sp. 16SWW S1-10-2]|uniref:TlpA family protein disulfide reductase n=1 Tax=Ancylomarina sp. 16SWW S1-10-2 TaxID=2499681 RepID=UPI0012AD9CA8|nr:TlpA disulfide reductase family protein [Ancylomarina sp. 16SWW S1-10-2]MRT94577.1 TlpA family protein disulfide reductase [Ancylomarina sp. 16SWW S1-10-2]